MAIHPGFNIYAQSNIIFIYLKALLSIISSQLKHWLEANYSCATYHYCYYWTSPFADTLRHLVLKRTQNSSKSVAQHVNRQKPTTTKRKNISEPCSDSGIKRWFWVPAAFLLRLNFSLMSAHFLHNPSMPLLTIVFSLRGTGSRCQGWRPFVNP